MKKLTYLSLASVFLLGGISSCSSTNTETTDTPPTTEVITADTTARNAAGADTMATAAPAPLSYDSTNFGILAASNDLLEIMTSEEALTKAKNPEVQKFAQQMIAEHKKAYQDLKSLSAMKNQRVPTELLPKHQKMYSEYQKNLSKEPNKYDLAYMKLQVSAHEEAVELFDDGDEDHPDPDLRAYATKLFPQIKADFQMAKKTKDIVD
jgi:putative membrane protein